MEIFEQIRIDKNQNVFTVWPMFLYLKNCCILLIMSFNYSRIEKNTNVTKRENIH